MTCQTKKLQANGRSGTESVSALLELTLNALNAGALVSTDPWDEQTTFDCRYLKRSIEPTSLHTFSIHFIQNLFYFVQFSEFAPPEPTRPMPQQHRLHQHAGNQQRNPLLRMHLHVPPDN